MKTLPNNSHWENDMHASCKLTLTHIHDHHGSRVSAKKDQTNISSGKQSKIKIQSLNHHQYNELSNTPVKISYLPFYVIWFDRKNSRTIDTVYATGLKVLVNKCMKSPKWTFGLTGVQICFGVTMVNTRKANLSTIDLTREQNGFLATKMKKILVFSHVKSSTRHGS